MRQLESQRISDQIELKYHSGHGTKKINNGGGRKRCILNITTGV